MQIDKSLWFRLQAAAAPPSAPAPSAMPYVDAEDIPAPTAATEIAYSPLYSRLVIKNSASAVFVINTKTKRAESHLANIDFTDMSMSPSGRYVFVADYGGENIG